VKFLASERNLESVNMVLYHHELIKNNGYLGLLDYIYDTTTDENIREVIGEFLNSHECSEH